jgi:hypothetical protein
MKLVSRIVAATALVAVSGASLAACLVPTSPFKPTVMPRGTTINTILNGAPSAANPYAGFFFGFQQELLLGNGTTGVAAVDPVTGTPLITELGLDGSPTTGKYTVVVAPDAYMPSYGGSLALYTTVINNQTVQQMVAGYSVLTGQQDFSAIVSVLTGYHTLGGYNIFGLHSCVPDPAPAKTSKGYLTINNAHVLAAYKVDNGVVYVVDGVSIPQI